jgi:hypothetical protein
MNIKSGKSQIESEEVDREIELSPSKTPMPVSHHSLTFAYIDSL